MTYQTETGAWTATGYTNPGASVGFTAQDNAVLSRVEEYLERGLKLRQWWRAAHAANSFADKFPLTRSFNEADTSFGFFDQVAYGGTAPGVMGNYQEMLYDQPKGPAKYAAHMAGWMRDQMREFALRYFMRISSFCAPSAYVAANTPQLPPWLDRLSWCPAAYHDRAGFGFHQLYYKLRATGEIGKFDSEDEYRIVDLREIGSKYEWVVVKVDIFDFKFTLEPFGPGSPQLVVPLTEESYLVLHRDFICNQDCEQPGVLGEYGFGYAFIKDPAEGVVAYGPGQFDAAIELINFKVLESGLTRIAMAFVANRPADIARVNIDPVGWSFRLADVMSLGMSSRLMGPMRDAFDRLTPKLGQVDPVYGFISLANALSGGQAARQLCISRETLDTFFLVRHFMQHYQTAVGSLLTWRQVNDWLDAAALPKWIIEGRRA